MWSIIKKTDVDSFFRQYPELEEFKETFLINESGENYILPRYFCLNYPSKLIKHLEIAYKPENIKMEFNGTLRPTQNEIMQTLSPIYSENGYINGVIKARPGAGKTVTAIYIASKLKLKTLFLVDNTNLMKQWISEILTYSDLQPEDIGIIKGKLFSTDKPVTVGTVQTLLSKFKKDPKDLYEKIKDVGFGLVIFDEVHKTSASEKYSKISSVFPTKNIIGLSATPYKFGEQDILMKNVIGDIIYDGKDYDLIPDVNFVYYESGLEKYRGVLSRLDYTQKKSYYNSVITKSKKYIDVVTTLVERDLAENHRVIVICWTENQVKTISEALTEKGITNTQFYGKSRTFSETDKVLVVTYSFAGTGFNYKELSSLIYACPLSGKVSLIQTAGRILRECKNKEKPKISDLVDISFPLMFLPEIDKKKKILNEEFKCEFNENREFVDASK